MQKWHENVRQRWDAFSQQHLEWALGAAMGTLLMGLFLVLTLTVRVASPLLRFDNPILAWFATLRTPFLTSAALTITQLGASDVLGVICALFVIVLWVFRRDSWAALQMAVASAGTWAWVSLGKKLIARPRPDALQAVIESGGFSYPSGHALASAAIYFTAALLFARGEPSAAKRRALMAIAWALIISIGLTRVYLGVHYFTDVVAGLLLGTSWALWVEAAACFCSRHRKQKIAHREIDA